MWQYIVEGAIWAGLYIYNRYLQPKAPPPKTLTLDNLQLPRTEDGTPVPLIYGRTQVKSAVLVQTSVLNSKMGPDDRYINYGLHMLFVVGLPMGAGTTRANALNGPLLHNVWIGDNPLPSPGQLPKTGPNGIQYARNVFLPQLFGGEGRGGGLLGSYWWFGGWNDQSIVAPATPIGDALTAAISAKGVPTTQLSGHRKQMAVGFTYLIQDGSASGSTASPVAYQNATIIDTYNGGKPVGSTTLPPAFGFMLGENPHVDGVAFEVSSYGDQVFAMTTPGFDFGGDADPVEVIYDLLTNPWGRLGLDVSKIDMPSFLSASTTLKAEGHGYSNAIMSSVDATQAITDVLKQIDAAVYEEPTTGKFVIKLIRQDYSIPALPLFDETNILSVDNYSSGAWRDTVNEVRVKYADRVNQYNPTTAIAQNMANAVGNSNRRRPIVIDYPGISNAKIAAAVAARDLGVLSYPLGKIKLTMNRDGWTLRPGSVFRVNYAEYNLANVVFRVTRVDLGQLDADQVVVDAVQDAFPSTYGGLLPFWNVLPAAQPYPITNRIYVEAPRWLCHEGHLAGIINDVDLTRILPLMVANTNDDQFLVYSQQSTSAWGQIFNELQLDVPRQNFPTTFTLVNSYARELEPYDTTTGIVVQNVVGDLAATFASLAGTATNIQAHGVNLIMVVTAAGDMEAMSFESVTALGGGQYRLNNVWRGLLDTPPLAHAAGERGFFVSAMLLGRRGWSSPKTLALKTLPYTGQTYGSGEDPIDLFQSSGFYQLVPSLSNANATPRGFLPISPANAALAGEGLQGTIGTPGTAGFFKSCSLLEEAVDVSGFKRDHWKGSVVRGDAADDTLPDSSSTTYVVEAWPTGQYAPARATGGLAIAATTVGPAYFTGISAVTGLAAQYLAGGGYRFDLFGSIDVGMAAQKNVTYGDPDLGKGGVAFGTTLFGWGDPRVTCYAPAWRNLLGNVRWNYAGTGFGGRPWLWDFGSLSNGAPTIISGNTFSLSRLTAGANSGWLGAGSTTSPMEVGQKASIRSWLARGLTAIGICYIKNQNLDANDTGQLRLDAFDRTSGALANTSSAATIGGTTTWSRLRVAQTLPAATAFSQLTLIAAEVATGGTTNPDTAFVESELRVGQFQDNVLGNYSFDSATLASWTTDSGTWTTPTTIASPSSTYAINSGASNGQIHQDYTPPAGWESGSQAFVTCFRGSTVATNTGEVIVQALDGSSVVLASGTTGAEAFATLNVWSKRTVWCDMPDGTVKIRVILKGNYTAGASSGQIFDEVALWVAKDRTPRSITALDFSLPTTQILPTSWQSYVLAYPTHPAPSIVINGVDLLGNELRWTDGVAHAPAKVTGQFGGANTKRTLSAFGVPTYTTTNYGTTSVSGYQFFRGSGAGATHLAASGQGYGLGAFSLAQAFSIAILYRVDEYAFGGRCGLVGRMDLGQGWGLELDASGHLTALLRGAGATTKTVSLARVASDGALHLGALVYDPVAQTLTVYDEVGSASVSTVGLGEILGTSSACHLRVGRDADDADVLPGQIARVFGWSSALSGAVVGQIWTYAKDPTGLLTTYSRSAAAVCAGPPDALGEVLSVLSPTQVAMPWTQRLANDDSNNLDGTLLDGSGNVVGLASYTQTYKKTGYGLALGRAVANRIGSWDFSNASFWTKDASTALTTGIVDPTGRPRGVTVVGDAGNGIRTIGVTVGAVANTVVLSFWARAATGTPTLKVELYSSVPTLITSGTVVLSTLWKRYDVLLAWTGATATCQFRLVSNAGALTFDLAGVVHAGELSAANAAVPHLIPMPASSLGDVTAQATPTLPAQFNSEGEIVAVGCNWGADPGALVATGSLVQVRNGVNLKNARELQEIGTGSKFRLAHTDGNVPTTVNSDVAEANGFTSHVWKARGRWSRADMLDTNAPMTAQVAYADDAAATIALGGAGRTTAWTNDTTPSTQINLGSGGGTAPESVVLHCILVQAREEKLP